MTSIKAPEAEVCNRTITVHCCKIVMLLMRYGMGREDAISPHRLQRMHLSLLLRVATQAVVNTSQKLNQ